MINFATVIPQRQKIELIKEINCTWEKVVIYRCIYPCTNNFASLFIIFPLYIWNFFYEKNKISRQASALSHLSGVGDCFPKILIAMS